MLMICMWTKPNTKSAYRKYGKKLKSKFSDDYAGNFEACYGFKTGDKCKCTMLWAIFIMNQ